ncbi:SIP domain-containing protein [Gordonia malaquae]|uniref:SIP domain-containing protein n=1 Tax=Gordonia malaquae TaxID=410332 RepID=UPI0009FE4697|nr:SIP domain-containing protein [Gordonia malaquae]
MIITRWPTSSAALTSTACPPLSPSHQTPPLQGTHPLPLRVRPQDTVHWIRRERDGLGLVEAVKAAAFDASGAHAWVALDAASTRAVTAAFRSDFKLGRGGVKSRAYWRVGKPFA